MDPTLNLTFQEMQKRVAEYLGSADYSGGAAAVPTDARDLDLVKRLVNDGYRRFITDNEKGWNFLTVPLSLTFGTGTVSADNARYYLPDDFYGVLTAPFTYGTNGPRTLIEPVSEAGLRERAAISNTTGTASVFTVRAINVTATTTAQRWEAIFWPTPSGTETVTAVYKRFPAALSSNTDRSVAGFQHDQAVLAAALAAAELHIYDKQGERERSYQTALAMSLRIDSRASDQRKQGYGDKSEDGWTGRPSNYYRVDTVGGVPVD